MSKANRVQLAFVRDTDPEAALSTPRMRKFAVVSENLATGPTFLDDEEINADRMNVDPALNFTNVGGSIQGQWRYPTNDRYLSEVVRSGAFNPWVLTPERDNDGTADSVITDVANSGGVITVTTGAAFVVGQLVRTTGFTNAGNNGINRVTTGSATVPAFSGASFVDEAAPPATARMKVVGFAGASGDITATATGLGSTTLNFTTLGIAIGSFVKIGGTAAGTRFATAALNDWARVTAVAATALTLDHLPAGWTTDAGTSKTIWVFFGDSIKNGVTLSQMAIEKGALGQQTPNYEVQRGQTVNRLAWGFTSKQKVTVGIDFVGQKVSTSQSTLDASPDDPDPARIVAANVNIGRLWEGGVRLGGPNFCDAATIEIMNNLEGVDELESAYNVALYDGNCDVTGRIQTLFGDNTLRAKFLAGTPTSLALRAQKDGQAVVWSLPRITFNGEGNWQAQRKNDKLRLPLAYRASRDTLTNAHIVITRLEYYE